MIPKKKVNNLFQRFCTSGFLFDDTEVGLFVTSLSVMETVNPLGY